MFDLSGVSVDGIFQVLSSLEEKEVEHRFAKGEVLAYAIKMGLKAGELGAAMRRSEGYVRQLVKVHEAFPTAEARLNYPEQEFQHFKLAAYTDKPAYWMDQAKEHGWSSREMTLAIKGQPVKDELREAERIAGKVERCLVDGGQAADYLTKKLKVILREFSETEVQEETQANSI